MTDVSGSIDVSGTVDVSGSIDVSGSVDISGTVDVLGSQTISAETTDISGAETSVDTVLNTVRSRITERCAIS